MILKIFHTKLLAAILLLSTWMTVPAEQGVFIFKQNSSVSDSSAVAGKYTSFQRRGATAIFNVPSAGRVSVTKFQPLLILPEITLAPGMTIRTSQLTEYTGTRQHYAAAYNKYPKSRSLLIGQIDVLDEIIKNLKSGKGYHGGRWVADGDIDGLIAEESRQSHPDALARMDELVLKDGKVYKDVVVLKKLRDKVSITHSSGIAGISYQNLPDDLRSKLGKFEAELHPLPEKLATTPAKESNVHTKPDQSAPFKSAADKPMEKKVVTASPMPHLILRGANLKGIYLGMPKDEAFARVKTLVGPGTELVKRSQEASMGPNVYSFYITRPDQDIREKLSNFIIVDLDNDSVLGVGFHAGIFNKVYEFDGSIKEFAKQFMDAYNIPEMKVHKDEGDFVQWIFSTPDFRYVLGRMDPGKQKHIYIERVRKVNF